MITFYCVAEDHSDGKDRMYVTSSDSLSKTARIVRISDYDTGDETLCEYVCKDDAILALDDILEDNPNDWFKTPDIPERDIYHCFEYRPESKYSDTTDLKNTAIQNIMTS
jgi:hypothetical protein